MYCDKPLISHGARVAQFRVKNHDTCRNLGITVFVCPLKIISPIVTLVNSLYRFSIFPNLGVVSSNLAGRTILSRT